MVNEFTTTFGGLVTQSDGIALSSPGKLDDRFGYHCHCGTIAIGQPQLTQCSAAASTATVSGPKTSCSRSAGFEIGISRYALKHAPPAGGKKTERQNEE
jgi:translation initiation factor 6 (eIF-6)